MSYLADTDVIITILKGNAEVKRFVEASPVVVDTTVYIETLQGSKSNRDNTVDQEISV